MITASASCAARKGLVGRRQLGCGRETLSSERPLSVRSSCSPYHQLLCTATINVSSASCPEEGCGVLLFVTNNVLCMTCS